MLRIIPLDGDLIAATVEEITADSQHDFSHFTVVSPSKRLLFFIRDCLKRTIPHSHFPPELLTIDQFVSKLFRLNHKEFQMIDNLQSLLTIYRSVREVFRDSVYTGGKIPPDFPGFFPWALVIRKAVEELLVESPEIKDVNQAIYGKFAELGEYHREFKGFIVRLPALVEEFVKRLMVHRLFTRGMAYRMVADLAQEGSLEVPGDKITVITGMGLPNASEEKILGFLADRGGFRILIKSDEGAIMRPGSPFCVHQPLLKIAGLSPANEERETRWNRFSQKVWLYCLPNIESQMLQTAEILAEAAKNKTQEELKKIAVILPESASLIPFVHGVVSRLTGKSGIVPFNITLGYPFVRTPLYQLLRFILKVFESRKNGEYYYKDYLNLIRHPYVKLSGSDGNEQEPLKRGIHLIEEMINRENLITFTLRDIEERVERVLEGPALPDAELRDRVKREILGLHTRFIINRNFSLQELGEFLKGAVLTLKKNRSGHLFLGEYIATAVQTLDQVIRFSRENEDEVGYSEFSSLISMITYCFSQTHVYFEGSPLKGIQVMGVLESRGLGFDEVILVDVMEGVLPQRLKYDPVLPYDIRKLFKIRGYREWENLFAFNFFSLIGGAEKTHLLWMDRSEGMQKTEKSRFIERILFEIEKQGEPSPPVARNSCPLRLKKTRLREVKKTASIRDRIGQIVFSPSMLETYIHCPLRFYFSVVMGLRERAEPTEDPDSGELGTMVHDVMDALYRSRERSGSTLDMEARLESLIKKQYENRGLGISSGTNKIRLWVLKEKLADFVRQDQRRIRKQGIEIRDTEKKISVNLTFSFSPNPVSFRGRIDRIEADRGTLRLIDYKTGSPFDPRVSLEMKGYRVKDLHFQCQPGYRDNLRDIRKTYRNFQILLYCLLVGASWGIDPWDIDAAYVFLKPAEDFFRPVFVYGRKQELVSEQDKMEIMESFYHNLEEVVRDVFEGPAFLADNRDPSYCRYCPFRIPCGNME